MSRETNPASGGAALPNWFRAVCFVLIVLLAHNPYLMAPLKAGGLNVSHRPSYRATIAASELQHFTPPENQSVLTALAVVISADLAPLQQDERQAVVYCSQVLSPPQQFWCASLWFRPPPASSR